jgi:peptide deformylase
MAKLKIYTFPDLVLTQKASPIARVEKPMHKLADDMLETMYHAPGIGLAANQVGILQRILVLDTEYDLEELPEGVPPPTGVEVVGGGIIKNRKPKIVINPEIIHHEGSIQMAEGCLSVPEYSAEVKRYEKIKLRYQDIDGVTRELMADGLMAVAIQHEMDHLEGKLFIDRLSSLKKEMVRKRLRKERAEREAMDDEERLFGSPELGSQRPGKNKKKGF